MRACWSRNGTVREVGTELLALLLSSLIRWTRRWPGLSVLARAGAGWPTGALTRRREGEQSISEESARWAGMDGSLVADG
jgi:hypothetical protein